MWLMGILKIYLPERILILCYKVFDIATNPKCDEHQRGSDSVVYKFLIKGLLSSCANKSVGTHMETRISCNSSSEY